MAHAGVLLAKGLLLLGSDGALPDTETEAGSPEFVDAPGERIEESV